LEVVSEFSEVDRRGDDHYWNNIENTLAQPDRSSEFEKLFPTDASRVVV